MVDAEGVEAEDGEEASDMPEPTPGDHVKPQPQP